MRRHLYPLFLWSALALLLAAQVAFTFTHRGLRAAIEAMPPPPSERALDAMAFGDREFLFRHLGRWLQGVGDGGGRLRPLRVYDYDRVVAWLKAVDGLGSPDSQFIPYLAAHYFGRVFISPPRVRKIVDYMIATGLADPARRWSSLVWAAATIRETLKDKDLAAGTAARLLATDLAAPEIPMVVRLLPIRLYQFAGEDVKALAAFRALPTADRAELEAEREKMAKGLAARRAREAGKGVTGN